MRTSKFQHSKVPVWSVLITVIGVAVLILIGYGTAELCNAEPGSTQATCENGSTVFRAATALFAVSAVSIGLPVFERSRPIRIAARVVQVAIVCAAIIMFRGAGDIRLTWSDALEVPPL